MNSLIQMGYKIKDLKEFEEFLRTRCSAEVQGNKTTLIVDDGRKLQWYDPIDIYPNIKEITPNNTDMCEPTLKQKLDSKLNDILQLAGKVDEIKMNTHTKDDLALSIVGCIPDYVHWTKYMDIPISCDDNIPYGEFEIEFKCF